MNYEALYITHLPSFYKINIFNEIAKDNRILVIFIGEKSIQRKDDFINGVMNFDYLFLEECEFEKTRKIKTSIKLLKILKDISFRKIIVGGYDMPHFWLALIFSKFFKQTTKATIIESSIIESKLNPLKLYLKKIFLFFNDAVIVAGGGSHKDLILKINKNKKIFIANGVGIPNIFYANINKQDYTPQNGYFLYIGRISKEKNIDLLLECFRDSKFHLNIIGGKIDTKYSNIKCLDYIDNQNLPNIIQNHIALILPSISEPWGLVVDETLLCGVGVIASSNVGSGSELIKPYKSGIIFENNNLAKLKLALETMNENYLYFHQNASKIDFKARYENMKKAYLLDE